MYIHELSLIESVRLRVMTALAVMRAALRPKNHAHAGTVDDAVTLQIGRQTKLLRHA